MYATYWKNSDLNNEFENEETNYFVRHLCEKSLEIEQKCVHYMIPNRKTLYYRFFLNAFQVIIFKQYMQCTDKNSGVFN